MTKENESTESLAPLVWGSGCPGYSMIQKVKLSRPLAQNESHLKEQGI